MMRRLISLFYVAVCVLPIFSAQVANFENGENVKFNQVLSRYKNNSVVFLKNDSFFIAELDSRGKIVNATYSTDFDWIQPEGQFAYSEKSGELYYVNGGKLFKAKQRKSGKWVNSAYIEVKGSEVKRDKYPGSVLAYANWRYLPKDSIVIVNPTINSQGDVLYFSSNMNNTKGKDIWEMSKDQNGEWGNPVRMDASVNTVDADEDFPFVNDEGMLVFASNRGNTSKSDSTYSLFSKSVPVDYEQHNKAKEERLLAALKRDSIEMQKRILEEQRLAEEKRVADSILIAGLTNGNVDSSGTLIGDSSFAMADTVISAPNVKKNTPSDRPEVSFASVDSVIAAAKSNPNTVVKISDNVYGTLDKRIFYFDYDKQVANGTFERDILIVLDFINAFPNSDFLIVGHTDERGSLEYNEALSLRRAQWVMFQLLMKDVSPYRLNVKGEGELKPIVKDAKTEAEHQKNRRVEILKLN